MSAAWARAANQSCHFSYLSEFVVHGPMPLLPRDRPWGGIRACSSVHGRPRSYVSSGVVGVTRIGGRRLLEFDLLLRRFAQ
jgi:hypothetical protein